MVAKRPSGTVALNCARSSGESPPMKVGSSGVSAITGATAQTRMPSAASSAAIDLDSRFTAPLEALYQVSPGRGLIPAVDPILMITPDLCARMRGTTACANRKIDLTLTANIRSNSASSTSSIGRRMWVMPALLTRMSIVPKALSVAFTAASTSARRDTSQPTAIALLLMAAAVARAACSLMSMTATRAPSRAKVSAIPLPKPDPPPVTSATLLSRRIELSLHRSVSLTRDRPLADPYRLSPTSAGSVSRASAFPDRPGNDTLFPSADTERIMRIAHVLVASTALFAAINPAAAASQAEWEACKGNDPDRSIAACTRIIQRRGETTTDAAIAYYSRGSAYANKGDGERAIADFSEAIRLSPKVEFYFFRGFLYATKNDLDRAIADFSAAIQLDPKFADGYINRGNMYSSRGDLDRAIADFTEAVRLAPGVTKAAGALFNRGNAYSDKGDIARAIADYSETIRLDPKFAQAYGMRAAAYLVQGNKERASADYKEAMRLDPTLASASNERGKVYQLQGDYDRAINNYNQAIQLDPKLAAAYNNRGSVYLGKDDNDRAMADFNEAIRLDPNFSLAYSNRGLVHLQQGHSDRALADFDEAVRLAPNNAFAYMGRGNVYRARGNNARAIADYGATIRLDPKFLLAYLARGDAYRARGDNDHAIADYSEAIRLEPRFGNAYYSRGLAYLYGGTLDKALADGSQASDFDPANAYKALWSDIVAQRNNAPSHLSPASANIDMTQWPAPIVRMYLGRMPPEAVLAAADDPDAKKKKSQLCQANFYSGEWALRMGAKDEAVRLFRLAASGCAEDVDESFDDNDELKALGGAP